MSPKTVNYGGKNLGFGGGRFLQKTYVSVSVSDTATTLESSRERNGQGVKGPGTERTRELIGQGPIGRFDPGSELAWEQKGSVTGEGNITSFPSLPMRLPPTI